VRARKTALEKHRILKTGSKTLVIKGKNGKPGLTGMKFMGGIFSVVFRGQSDCFFTGLRKQFLTGFYTV